MFKIELTLLHADKTIWRKLYPKSFVSFLFENFLLTCLTCSALLISCAKRTKYSFSTNQHNITVLIPNLYVPKRSHSYYSSNRSRRRQEGTNQAVITCFYTLLGLVVFSCQVRYDKDKDDDDDAWETNYEMEINASERMH